jgi:hypothetical protein
VTFVGVYFTDLCDEDGCGTTADVRPLSCWVVYVRDLSLQYWVGCCFAPSLLLVPCVVG